ncbi:DUF4363 family protein [Clostridium chromiireducens]|uniref:DUF4363 family protein n=1 Tax=Clostridium chromiireducens TaxID=225345 RepID=A0A1V4IST0_9CLOT|nr:DUF4363 family protein [Clostridium chromiireducens]MVX64680.1 DUF4363 family protein [Clostridium chromiireducens]OPJ62976.1 hypothetical protein CLCHR_18050 [Clostridium chromiireducens]RII36421.1 DUF4363 family protein [Clostridium chromiireducens]
MRNAILSILIFILTITCVYFLNNSILKLCDNISSQAEDIESKITSDKMEEAYSQSLELLNFIEENNNITSIYLSHQEFDNLLDESVRLCTYLVHENATDAHTSLHLVKHSIEHIKKLQMPNFENIL